MHTDDLCKLPDTSPDTLLDILYERYISNRIYTNAGLVLISINPYTKLDIYGTNVMTAYFRNTSVNADPHIYNLCESSYQDMLTVDQTILISGESGSGKTENTKYIQDYLIFRTNTPSLLKCKIDALTLILESFGNAKTLLNDNSSRVGKMISFFINGDIKGISVQTFLLEKSRVTHQNEGESNFNIFYQLCKYKKLNINNDYIKTSHNDGIKMGHIDGIKTSHNDDTKMGHNDGIKNGHNDYDDYANIRKAFISLNFPDIQFIEEILLSILYLGYVKFISINEEICVEEKSKIYLKKIIKNSNNNWENILLKKEIKVGNEVLVKYNTIDECYTIRDSISRLLYVSIFEYIVDHVNRNFDKSGEYSTLNILDIFGFEIFKNNSLDQLCINYANEKIQHNFIKKIFEEKQEEYSQEIADYKFIPYSENFVTINEFEKRCGLFDLIDEESTNRLFQSLNDSTKSDNINKKDINTKFNSENLRNKIKQYISKGIKIKSNEKLLVKHFVKEVEYNINELIYKNKENKINLNIPKLNIKSTGTVVKSFLRSLNDLFNVINSTQVKYIRCIKPNETKSNTFNREIIYNQLLCTGILEIIKISKQTFTYEMDKEIFQKKYKIKKGVLEGKTKVYFNSRIKRGLEASEWRQSEKKKRILEWFMRKLLEKKEGINLGNIIETKMSDIIETKDDDIMEGDDIIETKDDDIIETKDDDIMEGDDIIETKNDDIIEGDDIIETKMSDIIETKDDDIMEGDDEVVDIEMKNIEISKKEKIKFKNEKEESQIKKEHSNNIISEEGLVMDREIIEKVSGNILQSSKLNSMEDMISDLFDTYEENDEQASLILNYGKRDYTNILSEGEQKLDINIIKEEDLKLEKELSLEEGLNMEKNLNLELNLEKNNIKEKDLKLEKNSIKDEDLEKNIIKNEDLENNNIKYEDLNLEKEDLENNNLCSNCSTLHLKYKFVSEALKEANLKLSKIDKNSIPYLENASSLFSRLFNLYLENIPSYKSEDIPKSEILSYAHASYLITIRVNKNIKESVSIFTEELSLRIKYFERNINYLIFYISNLIEYKKLINNNNDVIINNIDDLDDLINNLFIYLCELQKESLVEYIPFSITEHQELLNFKCSDSIIKKIFKPVSIYKLIKNLECLSSQMDYYYLDEEYKKKSLDYLLDFINVEVFNSLLVKKNFLSFNRCIQINYNINQIYKFLNNISYVEGMSNLQHVMEVIKLINICSSKNKEGLIEEQCKILTSEQIKTFLRKMDYEYKIKEDGKKEVFIKVKPVESGIVKTSVGENFVVPRYISSEDLSFLNI